MFYHDFLIDDNLYVSIERYECIICGGSSCQDQYEEKGFV